MIRFLAVCGCVVVVAGTLGEETCAVAAGASHCATTLAGSDHSLLQVHSASTGAAPKKKGPSGDEAAKPVGTEIQQDEAVQRAKIKKEGEGLGSEAKMDPYPEDNNLDTDYPRDDEGTHADTIREVQNATLPGDGDIGKNTKPGLSDSWNVDTMFVTDSDGGGHVSLRDMIPWGYRSQTGTQEAGKQNHENNVDKSGLLSEGRRARPGQESENDDARRLQSRSSTQASTAQSPDSELESAPTGRRKHAARSVPTNEVKTVSAARR